jgi:hypothetical protein
MVRLIVNQVMKMSAVQAKRMKLPLNEFLGLIRDDFWIYGADAVTKNAADKVSTVSCTSALLQGTKTVAYRTMFGNIELEFSACPLLTNPVEIDEEQKFTPHSELDGTSIKTLNRIN